MYTADVERMVPLAEKKVEYLRSNPIGYFVLSALAGIYLGFGICLIFSVGAPFWAEGSAGFKLVMGVSFGIALTLVIFAGSELFTGNKWELFVRGILCNWLVCLAVWTAARTTNDAAKIMLIFWCLFAFIGSGFEHSIANQSILGIALFLPHGPEVSWGGFIWNQLWVVSGNIVGGVVFMGGAYWVTSPARDWTKQTETVTKAVVHAASRRIRVPAEGKVLSNPLVVGQEN
jgi:formate/nitrite transporter FocA (FNT family)